jgi:hypothetical protein
MLMPEAEPREKLAALRAIGLTDSDLADATATSESAVAKWRSQTLPAPSARTKLDQVRVVAHYLIVHGISPAGAYGWITGLDAGLGWQSPLSLIGEGEFQRVVDRLDEISPREPLLDD